MMRMTEISTRDELMSDALSRFVQDVAGADVGVTFSAGTAFVRGTVRSETRARALADLVLHHEGVERVESRLRVREAPPAREQVTG
jgi:osmotically-inducible protein OsmY